MDDLESMLRETIRRIEAMSPEEFAKGLREATERAERINAEYAAKIRVDWRTLHEPMTI